MKNLISNWKTTSAGLLMIGGSIIHLIFAIINKTANENTWTLTLTAVVGGFGLMFAGDSSATTKQIEPIAKAVDKINQTGPSSETQMLSKPNQPPTP